MWATWIFSLRGLSQSCFWVHSRTACTQRQFPIHKLPVEVSFPPACLIFLSLRDASELAQEATHDSGKRHQGQDKFGEFIVTPSTVVISLVIFLELFTHQQLMTRVNENKGFGLIFHSFYFRASTLISLQYKHSKFIYSGIFPMWKRKKKKKQN